MQQPDFWSNQKQAKQKSQRLDELKGEILQWEKITKDVDDVLSLALDAQKEADSSIKNDLKKRLKELEKQFSSHFHKL